MIATLLPLALLGVGLLLYLIIVGATYALPMFVGLAAGLTGLAAGLSIAGASLVGISAFVLAIAVGRFMPLTLPRYGQFAVALAFALPAAIAGYSVGRMIAALVGFTVVGAIGSAMVCAAVAAQRVARPAGDEPAAGAT